jgi:L-seryl-tRNA(Ser) seleniumtransferase
MSSNINRRQLIQASLLSAAAVPGAAAATGKGLEIGPSIYQSIGVKPVVNCKGTFTIISGSQTLPEVKRAMDEASRHYVHLDELMAAVGKRLAEITGAEYGIVTSGCAAALAHATAACIAGADPEKLQRLPDLAGLKNEVIAPAYSRNVYDHAVRGVGVKMITVSSIEEYRAAFNPRTAMVMILAGGGDRGPLGLPTLAPIAKERGVPVLVDAAAERLTIPNIHLQAGADLVAYSGGKCLRGPQCAGLMIGRKDLLQAAWLHSAPHHAYGRPMKVGKEEIMGMLAAVEMWTKRDHDAEWKQWESWLDTISRSVKRVSGVRTEVLQPQGLSNNAPRLRVSWDGARLGVSGQQVERALLHGEPPIILGGSSGTLREPAESSVTIMPYMMMPGDAEIAAKALHAVLANPPKQSAPAKQAPASNLTGQWTADIEYVLGKATHTLVFEQKGSDLVGSHTGEFLASDIRGYIEGSAVAFRSSLPYEGTSLVYNFEGTISGDALSGTVDLGEFGQAKWTARRRQYGLPGRPVRPIKNI